MLKDLRKACGFEKQRDFCEALGEKQSTAATWETGRAKPGVFMVDKIAKVLKVSTDEVIACFKKEE